MEKKSLDRNAAIEQIKELQKQVDYDTRDYPIQYIVGKYEENEFFAPDYQRAFVWPESLRTKFVESIILGYPIPLIFLSESEDGRLEIVDGVQRISTLANFISGNLKLDNLPKLDKLNGFFFSDLPNSEQRKFKNKSLRIIVLGDKTEEETRTDLFERLNTTQFEAKDSEVRVGSRKNNKLMQLILKLKEKDKFKKAVYLSENKIIRKEDVELLCRFFAYSHNYLNFSHSVKEFIDEYMDNITTINGFEEEFNDTFDFIEACFPKKTLSKINDKGKPIGTPRVRFESLAVGVNLALRENPNLKVSENDIKSLLNSSEFLKLVTSDGSNSKSRVKERIEYVRDFLLEKGR
ncbi:DUF262 domain-containing protein [uncultured Dubosiella sp.]|uniref:DUF262 domain-containing protein n=1 Tax=uncultured Dubosiella sp. TaxID=1937011 RepID=UPI00272F8A85|nr:DUF262 domain-containing protein [uncultured Dubosiella sp.]